MRKRSWIALVGVCALALGGCGGEDTTTTTAPSPDAASPAPASPASPAPVAPRKAPAAKKPGAAKPVAEKPGVKPTVVATKATAPGLIQSTPASERVNKIQKGRKDPFAVIPNFVPKIVVQASPQGTPQRPTTQIKPLPNVRPGGTQIRPLPNVRPNIGTNPRPGGTLPGGSSPVAISPPPPPEPTTAKAVVVTGVVTIGNQPLVILKAPDEPTSRYVSVGQTLSNGEVRVKRIDESANGPVVILEQYGVEVEKAVGQKPEAASSAPGQPPG